MNFEQLVTVITDTHQQLQQSAVKAVNQHLNFNGQENSTYYIHNLICLLNIHS